MQLLPIKTPLIQEGDDFASILCKTADVHDGDILVLSSKAVAIAEGAIIDLKTIEITDEAEHWAEALHREHPDPAFRQAVINEAKRMNGSVISSCPHAMLAEVQPDGLSEGVIMAANAGLDKSNVPEGYAVGWPEDCAQSVKRLREEIANTTGKSIAVIITDSCCRPRRIGVTAVALAVSGIDPLQTEVGKKDLFGQSLRMTQEALADQLATAANILMGNAAQSIPAVIIRNHNIAFSDFEGWVPGIDPEEDLFKGVL